MLSPAADRLDAESPIYAIVLDHGLPLRLESTPLLLANVLFRIKTSLLPSLLPTLLAPPFHVNQRGEVPVAASSVADAPHAAQHSAPFWCLLVQKSDLKLVVLAHLPLEGPSTPPARVKAQY